MCIEIQRIFRIRLLDTKIQIKGCVSMGNFEITNLNKPMDIKLRERFCKDTNIPIKIFIEPYFNNRLELFNPMYGAEDKYKEFIKAIDGFKNPQSYFEFYNNVKDNAINSIKETDAFKEFNDCDMNKYAINDVNLKNIKRKDIFKKENDGKTFISIDLAKANFTALRWVDKSIVGNCDMYEQFIKQFCGDGFRHLIKSKYIRQVIFGNCNPRRQVTVEKYLMYIIIRDAILKHFDYADIECFTSDEVVIKVPSDISMRTYANFYDSLMEVVVREDIDIHSELFTLHNIENTLYFYKKFIVGGKGKDNIELKCVDGEMMPFVLRALQEEDVTDEDKVLMHNNMLAKLLDVPEIKFQL